MDGIEGARVGPPPVARLIPGPRYLNIFCARSLQNFLRALDVVRGVAVHRKQNPALLQAAFISLGLELGNTHTDECSRESTHCTSDTEPGKSCHDRACRDERSETRDCQQADSCENTERATDYAASRNARRSALRRFGGLLGSHVLRAAETLGHQYGDV